MPFSIVQCLPVKFNAFISLPSTSVIFIVAFVCFEEKEIVVLCVVAGRHLIIVTSRKDSRLRDTNSFLINQNAM